MLQDDIVTDAMRRALSLARRGPAGNPNPQVGCVILDPEGRIVAEGWHRGAGSPHAEVDALTRVPEEWHRRAQELTAVVTLEPCNHVGHTGPCAIALRDFGIGSVVYSVDDPGGTVSDGTGPHGTESNVTSAGGAQTLRDAGVEVTGGVLANEVRAFLRPWLTNVLRELGRLDGLDEATGLSAPRPRVIAKWAQTLDGRVAAANGTSQWITGTEARHDVHRRRAEADAILIGTGTLVVDNPALTARAPGGELLVSAAHQPIPIILGAREIPHDAKVLQHPALSAHELDQPLRLAGADLAAELAALGQHGINSVFVEGGPTVISSLLAAGLVDELLVYVAPALLGGPGLAVGDLGFQDISDIQRLHGVETIPLGPDTLFRAFISDSVVATGASLEKGS